MVSETNQGLRMSSGLAFYSPHNGEERIDFWGLKEQSPLSIKERFERMNKKEELAWSRVRGEQRRWMEYTVFTLY
jgi:hypothetical protein